MISAYNRTLVAPFRTVDLLRSYAFATHNEVTLFSPFVSETFEHVNVRRPSVTNRTMAS